MSKEEDLFKQQLSDMLSSQQFEMGADNWSGMEQLLNQQQRKRRGFFILFSGIGLLLIGTLTWLLLPTNSATTSAVAAERPTAQTSSPTEISVEQNINTNNTLTSKAPVQTKAIAKPAASGAEDFIAPTKNNQPAKINKHTTTTTKAVVEPLPIAANQPVVSSSAPEVGTTDMQHANNGNAVEPTIQPATTPVASTHEPVALNSAAATPAVTPAPAQPSIEVPVVAPTSTVAVSTLTSTASSVISEPASIATVPQDSIASKLPVKPDTIATTVIAAKPDTDYVAQKHIRFALEAGFSALSGWKVDDTRDAAGINPLLGAHVFYPISSELEVAIGLQYTTVGNLSNSKYTATVSHLDLGRVDESTVFTPLRLHYLVLPMKVLLQLSSKQSVGAGINAAYLLTSDSRVETFTYGYNNVTRTSSEIKKGYTQGFRNFDAQVAAYYSYKFSRKLEAQACLMYGLMDVKNGDALPSKGFERNSGGKISLYYSLFEK